MKLMRLRNALIAAGFAAMGVLATSVAQAGEAAIRKALSAGFKDLPKIDEIRPSPVPGLWEVRAGVDIAYTDSKGTYLFQGSIIETASQRDITQERIDKLTAIDFSSLPLQDAVIWKNGNGKRRIAIFADPNCGYCKQLEKDLSLVKDVTVHTFLVPILGGDSVEKSRSIWCAKDSTSTWRDWMISAVQPQKADSPCDTSALERNKALARKHKLYGTPAIVFENGVRSAGALSAVEIENKLARLR